MQRVAFFRISSITLFLFAFMLSARGQSQMNIQGPNFTNETVVKIVAGSAELLQSAIALEVEALETTFNTGTAGMFTGDFAGVFGTSPSGTGVLGTGLVRGVRGTSDNGNGLEGGSTDGIAMEAISTNGKGAFIEGGGGIAVELGGADSEYGAGTDDCVIKTQDDQTGGDMILVSNDAVDIHLDDDANSSSSFRIKDGGDDDVLTLNESGNLTISGTLSQGSDINRKHNILSIQPNEILQKVIDLPISEWSYKEEDIRHIGPMSQDFYAAFGLGQGETTISSIDADGVALASIKALVHENQELRDQLEVQRDLLDQLSIRISQLEK